MLGINKTAALAITRMPAAHKHSRQPSKKPTKPNQKQTVCQRRNDKPGILFFFFFCPRSNPFIYHLSKKKQRGAKAKP
jgi:hypothetical protein